jgi:hypothetical protein
MPAMSGGFISTSLATWAKNLLVGGARRQVAVLVGWGRLAPGDQAGHERPLDVLEPGGQPGDDAEGHQRPPPTGQLRASPHPHGAAR